MKILSSWSVLDVADCVVIILNVNFVITKVSDS